MPALLLLRQALPGVSLPQRWWLVGSGQEDYLSKELSLNEARLAAALHKASQLLEGSTVQLPELSRSSRWFDARWGWRRGGGDKQPQTDALPSAGSF